MTRKTMPGVEIGRRLSAQRALRGLPQAALARRAGLDPSYLSRIENGRIQPTVRTAARLAAALDVSLEELLAESPAARRDRPCPVNPSGRCLLDALDANPTPASAHGDTMTPRQLRLLRQVTALLQRGSPELLRSLEVLVRQLRRAETAPPHGS